MCNIYCTLQSLFTIKIFNEQLLSPPHQNQNPQHNLFHVVISSYCTTSTIRSDASTYVSPHSSPCLPHPKLDNRLDIAFRTGIGNA